MEYEIEGESHHLSFSKDELITLVALVHEGLENIERKAMGGSQLASLKYDDARSFVGALNRKILSV